VKSTCSCADYTTAACSMNASVSGFSPMANGLVTIGGRTIIPGVNFVGGPARLIFTIGSLCTVSQVYNVQKLSSMSEVGAGGITQFSATPAVHACNAVSPMTFALNIATAIPANGVLVIAAPRDKDYVTTFTNALPTGKGVVKVDEVIKRCRFRPTATLPQATDATSNVSPVVSLTAFDTARCEFRFTFSCEQPAGPFSITIKDVASDMDTGCCNRGNITDPGVWPYVIVRDENNNLVASAVDLTTPNDDIGALITEFDVTPQNYACGQRT